MSNKAAEAKKISGNEAFGKKKYDEAVKFYTEAVNLDPSHHIYYSNRCAAYLELKKFTEALKDAEECVRIRPDFVKGYHRLALAQKGLNLYEDALVTLKLGQKQDFNNTDLNKLINEIEPLAKKREQQKRSKMSPAERLKEKGNDAFKAASFEQAIGLYTDALNEITDKTSELAISCYNNRAACHQQLSNFSAVIADCTKVLEADHDNQKALLRRGLAYEGLERYRLALQDIRAVLSLNPSIEIANKAQHRIGQAVRSLKNSEKY